MPTDAETEAAARALCAHIGHDPDTMMPQGGTGGEYPMWKIWVEPVKAALEAAATSRSSIIRIDGEVPRPKLVIAQ